MSHQWMGEMRRWLSDGAEVEIPFLQDPRASHTSESWLTHQFHTQGDPIEAVQELGDIMCQAESTHDQNVLYRAFCLARMFGAYALWDTVVRVYSALKRWREPAPVRYLLENALHTLIDFESLKSSSSGHEATLPFWLELSQGDEPLLAFEGIRNHDLCLAICRLDLLLNLDEVTAPKERMARTLRGLRRDAAKKGMDLPSELAEFLKNAIPLTDLQRELLGDTLGHDVLDVAYAMVDLRA